MTGEQRRREAWNRRCPRCLRGGALKRIIGPSYLEAKDQTTVFVCRWCDWTSQTVEQAKLLRFPSAAVPS